jgi:transposase
VLTCGSFDGATDTDTFVVFVREVLAPHLVPGQVLVLDNLPAHRSPRVDEAVASVGARVMRLPPYSPDYNPIEMAFSKVKALLRKLGRRGVDALFDAIADGMSSITPDDARNFVRHCGYAATNG